MKKKNCKKRPTKYAFGGIENPNTALQQNQIDWAKAQLESNTGLTSMLDILGQVGMQVGSSMMSQGMSKGQGVSSGGFNWGSMLQQGLGATGALASFANGGTINVEGGEIVETQNGIPLEMVGPSHGQGGIDLAIPTGQTEIFSKRVKGPDGKTMAQRKKNREKLIEKIEKQLKDDPTNKILQRTLERTLTNNELEEQQDLMHMQSITNKKQKNNPKFADGGYINPAYNPSLWNWEQIARQTSFKRGDDSFLGKNFKKNLPDNFDSKMQEFTFENNLPLDFSNQWDVMALQKELGFDYLDGIMGQQTWDRLNKYTTPLNGTPAGYDLNVNNTPSTVNTNTTLTDFMPTTSSDGKGTGAGINWNDMLGSMSIGDMVGMVGNIYSMNEPMKNTLRNRAGDTPNINAFKDFGKEGLAVLDKSKAYVNQVRDQQLQGLEKARVGAINRGRNSARGVNTMRALDLATDNAVNTQQSQIFQQFAQAMMSILGQEAQMENQQDQVVMQGEQNRDLADRMDRDNFFSQMAQNIANKGTGIQKTAKDMNQIKTRNVTGKAMNQLFDYSQVDAMTGNIIQKQGIVISGSSPSEQIASYEAQAKMTEEEKKAWNSLTDLQKLDIIYKYKK